MRPEERYRRELKKMEGQSLLRSAVSYRGIDFLSNDYLSLRCNTEYLQYLSEADSLPATGSGGSRYLSGYHQELAEAEKFIADFYGAIRAYLFPAGYLANIAVFAALCSAQDVVFYDELCHASLKDGIRLAMARSYPWRHQSFSDLRGKISRLRSPKGFNFVVSEAVYSMDGDTTRLSELLSLCEELDAWLILDEAHSVGLYGRQGRGLAYNYKSPRLLCVMAGFGKAFALSGGALLFYHETVADFFSQKARPLIYSTAPAPRFCLQLSLAHKFFLERQEVLFAELQEKLNYFHEYATGCGFSDQNTHPIKIIKMNQRDQALNLAEFLRQRGMAAKAIVPPTVRAGSERLRLIVHRENQKAELKNLWQLIAEFQKLNLS